jgi:hypothetical protein
MQQMDESARIIIAEERVWFFEPYGKKTRVVFREGYDPRRVGADHIAFIAERISVIDNLPDFPLAKGRLSQ